MRWWVGAALALSATLVVGYWEAIVPHPDAAPRLVATVAGGETAEIGPVRVRLASFRSESAAAVRQEVGDVDLPEGAALVRVALDLAGTTAPAASCEVRLVVPDGTRTWLPQATTGVCAPPTTGGAATVTTWFALPAGLDPRAVLVEVRTAGPAPGAVRLAPTLP